MGKNVRCPCCGSTVTPSRIENAYPIEVFTIHGLGRGKGFRFVKVEDPSLFLRIKNKIKVLYESLFPRELKPNVSTRFRSNIRSFVHTNVSTKSRENTTIKIIPKEVNVYVR